MNLPTFLRRLEELEKAATPGPWIEREDLDYYQGGTYLGIGGYDYKDGSKVPGSAYFETNVCRIESSDSDKEFIAESRNALPLLIRIIRIQQEALQHFSDHCYGNYINEKSKDALAQVERVVEEIK